MNDRVGIVLAAGTDDPWGYPGGSILDAGRVTVPEGAPTSRAPPSVSDTVLTAQFLFNTWDAWAPSNAGMVYFDLVNYNFETKAIDDVNGMPAVQVTRKFTVPYNLNGVSSPPRPRRDLLLQHRAGQGLRLLVRHDPQQRVAHSRRGADNEVVISNKGSVGIDTKTVAALDGRQHVQLRRRRLAESPTSQFSTTLISPGVNPGSDGRTHPFSGIVGARGYRELRFCAIVPMWRVRAGRMSPT